MNGQLVVFTLDEQHNALCLPSVERVVHMVEVTPLPGVPKIVFKGVNVL
ncbi:MAG: hypothetical protein WC560_00875 [Syntrophales bacterium]